ncbi:phosphotransferase [Planktotalea sp.]|uniref:phosphotransferase n=1 Tax=Planktotalea sp. TaxID=2029877 RepID=UPI003D6BBF86
MKQEITEKIKALSCFEDPQDIEALGGGLTNVNVLLRDGDRKFVVRLGEDIPEHGVMRWNELAISQAASLLGISPKIVHNEPGVLVLEFVEGRTFNETDVREPDALLRIITLIKTTHQELGRHLEQPVLTFWPPHVNRSYLARLQAEGSTHQKALPDLHRQNTMLEQAIGPINLVIAHNDLLAANFIDDGNALWLIDWEYGGFNSPLFDLAGLASNNGLSEQQERAMLEQYFETNSDPIWRSYMAMKCCSLLRETLWSMTSEIHSELDVDYAAYTSENNAKLALALADFKQT